MAVRWKKLLGAGAILLFLVVYTAVAINLADHIPPVWPLKLAYFFVVGTAWGAPLLPLIAWMNREGPR